MHSNRINEGKYQRKKLFKFIVVTIFAGSVFFTSGKFVNAMNTPKLYFVIVALLVVVIAFSVRFKGVNFASAFTNKTMLWGINIICFLQACYGLCQFFDWLPSNHSKFVVTGSFDNPAGFAAIVSMGFPIGLYLLSKSKKVERFLVVIGLVVIALAIFLSSSRSGVLAISISSFTFFLFQTSIINKFQKVRHYKLLTILYLTFLLAGSFALYNQKKDSANGRLLIWNVSTEMIKDKPVFGHGCGTFRANYMEYQAGYFKDNPDSKYSQLADNVKHPFNEFIKVAVELGFVGLAITLSFILFAFWKITKSKNENREFVLNGLISFLVFACFSYPLQYISVWLLLAFYLSALLPTKEIKIRNTPISIITRSVIVIICMFSLFYVYRQIRAEIKWKTIAVNSLRGNTKEMLPEYEKLYSTSLKRNSFFLYNYGAELNVASLFDKSIEILTKCQKRFNDYDLQMLLADNYYKNGEHEKAIQIYKHASNMIPCRFLPLYQIFEIYKENGQSNLAIKYANKIINKKVKVASSTVSFIKSQATEYLDDNT